MRPPAQSAPQTVREAVECQLNNSFRTELLSTLLAKEMEPACPGPLLVWAGPGTLTIQTKALPQPNLHIVEILSCHVLILIYKPYSDADQHLD